MSKIEKLTDEQISKFPQYVDKWVKVGLCTSRITLEETIPIIHAVYKILGREKTPVVLLDDPIQAWLAVCMLCGKGAQVADQVRDQVWAQVGDQVWNHVADQVAAQVGGQVWAQVRAQVWDQVGDQVRDQVWDQVWDQVGAQVWDQVGDQVWAQVWNQVWDQVWDQVRDQVWDQVRGSCPSYVSPWLQGSFDANMFSAYDFFATELNLDMGKKWDQFLLWKETSKLGLIWPLENVCIVSQKPAEIHMRGGRLHRDGGPAIRYSDICNVWALNGVRVPKELAETPAGNLSLEMFKNEKNAEIRAQFVRKYGIERLKNEGKSIEKTEVYELVDMRPIFSRVNYAPYLFMRNPSTGTIHAEGVHPDCKTILQALNWRNQTEDNPIILT